MAFISIAEAIKKGKGKASIRGWVWRERGSSKLKFVVMRDSTNVLQCVIEKEVVGEELFAIADKLQIETSMELHGELAEDKRAPTGYELKVKDFTVIGNADNFPISKDQSVEFLADNRHLWIRSRKMTAIMKIRSTYCYARHQFFRKKGFHLFDPPILQPSQSEGGSTLFEVKYYKDKTYLSQSWQLYAEAAIFALEKIYDMSPTFRAEKSKTSRHLSEFWMAEAEVAWMNLHDVSELAKEEIKFCIQAVLKEHEEDLKFLEQDPKKLLAMSEKEWPTITYREALTILKDKKKMNVPFGKDLRTVEEEKLMELYDTPVVVTNYPKEAMAFYKPRDPKDPETALCFDMLAPVYGEIVGGSQRDTDIEALKEALKKEGEDISSYDWYLDLRKYGSVPHSGYGIGVERVIAWICGLENIKDAIAFPRTMLRWKP